MPKIEDDKFNPINSTVLYGYKDYFHDLSKLYESRNFPKILLLTGEKGMGKFTFSFHLVNFFFNKGQYDSKNLTININSNFYKKILLNINENYNYFGRRDNKKVNVDEIRQIKKNFNTTSLNGLDRFTILDDVDLLNSNSANALLKIIEEPSNLNYFILINNKKKKILDTLRSRSLEVKIFHKDEDKVNIAKNLSKKFNVNLDPYYKYIHKITPGYMIRICSCLNSLGIEVEHELYNSAETLLDKFKKEKNEIYIESIKFLLDLNIQKRFYGENSDIIKINFLKIKLSKLLFEYENFNLSKNSVLENLREM